MKTIMEFKQVTSFHASGHTKIVERILGEQKRGEFNALEVWEEHPIRVPAVAPSNLPFCQIININYLIRVIITLTVLKF